MDEIANAIRELALPLWCIFVANRLGCYLQALTTAHAPGIIQVSNIWSVVIMLIVDSREKWTQPVRKPDTHISAYLERHGIPWAVRKLDVGDYMMDGGSVTVDRKQGLEEVAKNLLNPADKKRFWNEVRLAHRLGVKLVILIEDGKRKCLNDVHGWRSPYSKVTGAAVIRQMERLRHSYGVEFVFCPKRSAAKKIMEILQNE